MVALRAVDELKPLVRLDDDIVLDRRGRLIVPCRYDAGYYRAGIYVLDTLFDTQDTPPTDGANPAVRGEFEEGRIYMIADGCAEAFDMKGRKIGK